MTTTADDHLIDLRQAVSAFVSAECDETTVRGFIGGSVETEDALWNALRTRTGLQSIGVPAEHGGDDGSLSELCVVLEETAKALAPLPFLSTAVLAPAVLTAAADDGARRDYLPAIADGSNTVAIAVVESPPSWDPDTWSASAAQSGDEWRISGTKSMVIDGTRADVIFVFAHAPQGLSLFCVEGQAAGLTRQPMRSLDLTRPLASITMADTPARLIGSPGAGSDVLDALLNTLRISLAAEALGGAQHCLDLSVDYAKTRVQFGRQIGSFQAIKHTCADMFVDLAAARATVLEALLASKNRSDELPALAALAFVESARVYAWIAEETIHVHGGIGFTWEHCAHLYFRRAKATQLFLGGPATDYHAVLTALGV
jgi:alkylation response protein AidB-like acyl-CoA dehydrogenase